ncbi:DUF2225 domain-containing protein [Clostridium algoriphilum]|uniref:DUF2225 domain-containing protein n=1 Tax=Clostridium algoriphilum TaxID=198347 RepID=UPI001CF26F99|nr:DUF2225 domain-containing protein [Clostridium algoriphilum]MCB2292867.1 DUF2225 domain-containing protein [Clostridium algoriphilum]
MDNKIFFDHDSLISDDGISNKTDNSGNETIKEEIEKKSKSLLYSTKVTCPVCENVFNATTVKSSAYRMINKDSDFFIRYSLINPYFYDVWVCNSCGYAAMKSDFNTLRKTEIDLVYKLITPKWRGRTYPEIYDVNTAIERYKLSLLNYIIINAKASKKAINCLKLAWMYRLLETENAKEIELRYLTQALDGLNDAYYVEAFPLYGMNKYSIMYLIGELNRRTGHSDQSLIWFSTIITTPDVKDNLKKLARDMKYLIKEEGTTNAKSSSLAATTNNKFSANKPDEENTTKKSGFLSKFFKH